MKPAANGRYLVCTRGWGTPTTNQHNIFYSEKLTNVSCAPDGIQTFVLWILSPTLYQLSNPVTPVRGTWVDSCVRLIHGTTWGDGVAQLAEHRLEIQRSEVRTSEKKTIVIDFPSQNVVLTRCRCAQPPCVHTHAYTDSVVHVIILWITETRNHCTHGKTTR